MKQYTVLGLAVLAGVAIGATAINGLNAQVKAPGAYAVVDISEVTDPELMKQLGPKAGPAAASAGGHSIVRTDNVVSLDGIAPKRFVRNHAFTLPSTTTSIRVWPLSNAEASAGASSFSLETLIA